MRFHHVVVAALAVVSPLASLPSADAFTAGLDLLPSYLCGPAMANATSGVITGLDGKPKALGGVLTKLQEYTFAHSKNVDAGNDFLYDPLTDPTLFLGAMHNANAAKRLKQFHGQGPAARVPVVPENVPNPIAADAVANPTVSNVLAEAVNDYNAQNIPTKAQTNILDVIHISAIPPAVGDTPGNQADPTAVKLPNVILPGQKVILSLLAKNNDPLNFLQPNAFDAANGGEAVLDGVILYAQDKGNRRVGKFVTGGEKAAPWPACGPDQAGTNQAGIVHTELLSETNVYSGVEFFLPYWYSWPVKGNPNPGNSTITFMGAAVSDNGFGYHQTQWQVQASPTLKFSPATTNIKDIAGCFATMPSLACLASCIDCNNKAGSSKNKAAKGAAVTCVADPTTGNPKLNQEVVWIATCKINGATTPVVPTGTIPQLVAAPAGGYTTADASGNDQPLSAQDQAQLDLIQQQVAAAGNGTQTDTTTNTNQTPAQTTCPKTVSAASGTTLSLFSTLAIAVAAILRQ